MKKPKVFVVSPIAHDAVSQWRCLGPLSLMEDIEITVATQEVNWTNFVTHDIVFMHRPFAPQHLQIMAQAVQYGKKLWIDYDDDLLNVMTDNPTFSNYGRQEIKDTVKNCLRLADVVTVTTEDLKKLYTPYAHDIRLVPNALDPRWITVKDKIIETYKIAWRGSDSHVRDLMEHAEGILSAYEKTKHTHKWQFYGYRNWLLADKMVTAEFPPYTGKSYFDAIGDHSPDVLYVPLFDHIFNRSKSYIAALEGSAAGAMIVAPDFQEWRQVPGLLRYSSPEDFKLKLQQAIDMPFAEKVARRNETISWFQKNRSIEQMNAIRSEVVKDLMKDA